MFIFQDTVYFPVHLYTLPIHIYFTYITFMCAYVYVIYVAIIQLYIYTHLYKKFLYEGKEFIS